MSARRQHLLGFSSRQPAGAPAPTQSTRLSAEGAEPACLVRLAAAHGGTQRPWEAELDSARAAWRAHVRIQLGAACEAHVRWSRGRSMPVLDNVEVIRHAHAFDGIDLRPVLLNVSAPTAMERGDGNWDTALHGLGGPGLTASLAQLTDAFNQHVWPARAQPSTRSKQWASWALVVTWAVARKAMDGILPMSTDTLKALTWDLLAFRMSRAQILAVRNAVQARHRSFALTPPIHGQGEFSAWARMLGSVMGSPIRLKFPIHKAVVAALLRRRPASVALNRNRLLTALATIACLRVSEVARLQSCDLWFDHFTGYGIPGFEGSCAVHVAKRKNDSVRRGHLPGVGRSQDPELDLVWQLQRWLGDMQLEPRSGCTKRARPAARCPACPPLFPKTRRGPGRAAVAATEGMSRQMVSDAIRTAVAEVGCAGAHFSGISARKGGLSTAIQAGVEEVVLYLQSGHGPERAARRYMQLLDPTRLMETFMAFGL